MIKFSYSISHMLKGEIEILEKTRDSSLLILLSPKEELLLQWESAIERVFTIQNPQGHALKRTEVVNLFLPQIKKTQVENEKILINYKRLHDILFYNFSLNPAPLNISIVKKILADLSISSKKFDMDEFGHVLSFIQVNPEHPVIQAGLAYALLSITVPDDYPYNLLPLIMAEVFLYKYGFDMRRILVLESYFLSASDSFKSLIEEAKKTKNFSNVLEYFTEAVSVQATKAHKKIQNKDAYKVYESLFKLTERQKEILSFVSRPGARITNKDVQKLCRVSQITASRELALLSTLGLLFPSGKGRSVHYVKI